MKFLITGGAGFVGANLALYFAERDHQVLCLDNLARRGSELNLPLFKEKKIGFVHGDIRNPEDLPKEKFDYVFECSAQPSAIDGYDNPIFDFTNNTVGLLNVLEYARKNDSAIIFWSTNKVYSGDRVNAIPFREYETRCSWDSSVYVDSDELKGFSYDHGISERFSIDGDQHSIYGMSKAMADLACQEYFDAFGLRTVVNRFSCLAGARQWGKCAQGWVAWWAIAAHLGYPVKYIGWGGKQVRDVLFIDDICRLVELQTQKIDVASGKVFNIGGSYMNTLSLIEATMLMEKMFGKKMDVSEVKEARKADHLIYISDIRKANRLLGWEPKIGIKEGYESIMRWVRNNENVLRGLYE